MSKQLNVNELTDVKKFERFSPHSQVFEILIESFDHVTKEMFEPTDTEPEVIELRACLKLLLELKKGGSMSFYETVRISNCIPTLIELFDVGLHEWIEGEGHPIAIRWSVSSRRSLSFAFNQIADYQSTEVYKNLAK